MNYKKVNKLAYNLPCQGDFMEYEQKARSMILSFMKRKKDMALRSFWKEFNDAKKCAIIACETHFYSENSSPFPTMLSWIEDEEYWSNVLEAIKKYQP